MTEKELRERAEQRLVEERDRRIAAHKRLHPEQFDEYGVLPSDSYRFVEDSLNEMLLSREMENERLKEEIERIKNVQSI